VTRRYFDWAATAVPDPEIAAACGETPFGNPSSIHAEGRAASERLENARVRCAAVLGVPPECLYFTSGGTESNAICLHALLLRPGKTSPVLFSAVEHPSVRQNCLVLERFGCAIGRIGVGGDGRVSPETLTRALERNRGARFAAIMAVNNETGAVMDMAALGAALRGAGDRPVHLHSDLVQAVGKVPLDIRGWGLDSAALSAHKLGGPRGVGLLYLRKPLEPVCVGGGQERGIRPGTENTAGALALAACLERRAAPPAVAAASAAAADRMAALIRALTRLPGCVLVPADREPVDPRFSPWILQVRFRGAPGEVVVRALDQAGFAVSTGSACSRASPERPALEAMGLDAAARREGIRVSQGWTTTSGDMDALAGAMKKTVLETL